MTPQPPRRTDARRNHERVLAAAAEMFAEHGTQASIPQIAERAQVGKATVYRSFPTKEDLVEAITRQSLAALGRRTAPALADTDPYQGLRRYVLELFDALARDRLLTERLADTTSPAATGMLDTLGDLLASARAAGTGGAAATVQDVRVVLCGVALQLGRLEERDPVVWGRYGELVLAALGR
jgi:AcrR family transcriptional regulator